MEKESVTKQNGGQESRADGKPLVTGIHPEGAGSRKDAPAVARGTASAAQAYYPPAADQDAEQRRKIAFWAITSVTFLIIAVFAVYLIIAGRQPQTPARRISVDGVEMYNPKSALANLTYNVAADTEFPDGIQEKYKALYAADRHFVGWLTVPNTSIDVAVYQTTDNSYYIKKDLWGRYSRYGTIFMDAYSNARELTRNTVLYGHNFDDDGDDSYDDYIFGDVHKYLDVAFYKENPVIEFNTLYKDYKWKVVGCFISNGNSDGDNGYLFYYIATGMNNDNFMQFIDNVKQRSYINTTVDIQPDDKILTLTTCTYLLDRNGSLQDMRCALVARMVRDGESEQVDTSGATQNENPRYPQLYYNVFGGSNPFSGADKWIPVE